MKVTILGGGNEIGASCLHIQMEETSIVIDAGMRMHGENVLPMFGMLEELSQPEAILVTHAHADHIGALPILHTMYPKVPVYATPPTADLMQIMMKDSYKILTDQSRVTESLMPYTEEQMNAFLQHIRLLPANGNLKVGNMQITAHRAGHIMGAVMYQMEVDGESLLVTGDLSFSSGRTIPGAKVVKGLHADVVIMESTYGNRMHSDRNTEEKRLANRVAETIENGGFALVPAFALGRAQEVLLILQDYMEKGLIPSFPIYVDGLVTPVSRVYKSYPHYLKGPVAHRVRANGDAFLTEGRCIAVSPQQRKDVVNGKPACIVASSGMLTGGASAWYAKYLVADQKNTILLTGYQDEESPGKKLLALADGTENTLDIDGTSHQVNCQVEKIGLSAHADASEMTRFIETIEPTYTLLVHGDDDARLSLADKIHPRFHPLLVENGETYPFEKRKEGKGIVGKRYQVNRQQELLRQKIGSVLLYKKDGAETLKFGICQNVHPKTATFFCDTGKGKLVRVEADHVVETIGPWGLSMEEFKEVSEDLLSFSRPYVEGIDWDVIPEYAVSLQEIFHALNMKDSRQQFAVALALQTLPEKNRHTDLEGTVGYKIDADFRFKLTNLDLAIQAIKMNPNHAMDFVRSYMDGHPRFQRCGVKDDYLSLSFDFPKGVANEERERIANEIKQQTGWDVEFSESVRHEAFQPLLSTLLGENTEMPSVHINEQLVVAKNKKPENVTAISDRFKEVTGFTLQFAEDKENTIPNHHDSEFYQPTSDIKPMENNQAISLAKQLAQAYNVTIYKTSMKQENGAPLMELHFISPEVAARYTEMLRELSNRIGMAVQFATQPKQNEIILSTKELTPVSWGLKGNPSIHIERKEVAVKITNQPTADEIAEVNSAIEKKTGYKLQVKIG
ncbi:MBL fold metallo-hydrolase [Aquibacillus salsiterrae]|uniref:MBL fold metallo-hydrolase n=1 Tax=Aquibacillus salsiterrae TaxID=2950439 RepID=A0A9X3WH42_9BACI|nr:MBL fold metallo-hydrolase [Aquibacillus salsiterrae]MDC3418311.1 MBL fold metallo-hydrolase [Aquibacillus salsiterrae]